MKKWYNVELNERDALEFRKYLLDNNIKFETSGCFELVHFEVWLAEEEVEKVDKVIDRIFGDIIKEVK
jgi:vacuolar-type H+-ATPase subunit I/STV1